MKNKKLPKISIVIVTYNNGRTIKKCVQAIKFQDYPKEKIEYLNIDGGSTDNTEKILKNHSFKIIKSPIPHNAEAQRAIGLMYAKNNLIVSLDADNYIPHKNWLKQMVEPFMSEKKIIHAGTIYFTYTETDNIFNRYVALFGVLDPVVFYIGKPDRLPYFKKKWAVGTILKETQRYYIVKFTHETLPTVGCNGVVYRKDLLLAHAQSDPSKFLHMDVFVDLLDKKYDTYAIVKNSISHDTAVNLRTLMKKRMAFLLSYYFKSKNSRMERRYYIYNPKKLSDTIKLILFILYTITLVKPFMDSLRGYIVIRDRAWFLHPIVCWVYLLAYSFATLKKILHI
ncbi:MAG: glycosyltransferase family 2 protein [Candidatus Levybacteria bacterium]|nr:glycosyltransferase family 2 protein [Candidatus Levybacteria bacterium]